jgi:DNA modification methylase
VGFWGEEMDTYYNSLNQRILSYLEQDPGDSFDGIIEKVAQTQ